LRAQAVKVIFFKLLRRRWIRGSRASLLLIVASSSQISLLKVIFAISWARLSPKTLRYFFFYCHLAVVFLSFLFPVYVFYLMREPRPLVCMPLSQKPTTTKTTCDHAHEPSQAQTHIQLFFFVFCLLVPAAPDEVTSKINKTKEGKRRLQIQTNKL